jgi:hypothetical protein
VIVVGVAAAAVAARRLASEAAGLRRASAEVRGLVEAAEQARVEATAVSHRGSEIAEVRAHRLAEWRSRLPLTGR